jgi:hypothetical protein
LERSLGFASSLLSRTGCLKLKLKLKLQLYDFAMSRKFEVIGPRRWRRIIYTLTAQW